MQCNTKSLVTGLSVSTAGAIHFGNLRNSIVHFGRIRSSLITGIANADACLPSNLVTAHKPQSCLFLFFLFRMSCVAEPSSAGYNTKPLPRWQTQPPQESHQDLM